MIDKCIFCGLQLDLGDCPNPDTDCRQRCFNCGAIDCVCDHAESQPSEDC